MHNKKLFFYSFGIDERNMKLVVSEDCVEVRETSKGYKALHKDGTLPKRYNDHILRAEVGGKVARSRKLVLGYDYQIVLEEDDKEKAVGIIKHLLLNKLKFYKNKVYTYECMINRFNAFGDEYER